MVVSGQLHAPGRFITGETAPGTDWIGNWVGLRVGLDPVAKSKSNRCPCREWNPGRPARTEQIIYISLNCMDFAWITIRIYGRSVLYKT
jgi:hypothetical protein